MTDRELAESQERAELRNSLTQAGAGDQDAFAMVYDRLIDDIWKLAAAATSNPDDRERVASDMFISLWRHSPTYDGSSPRVWASTFAWARRRASGGQHSDLG